MRRSRVAIAAAPDLQTGGGQRAVRTKAPGSANFFVAPHEANDCQIGVIAEGRRDRFRMNKGSR
jgi:hypothetical protein